jgi:hypothetical protein
VGALCCVCPDFSHGVKCEINLSFMGNSLL